MLDGHVHARWIRAHSMDESILDGFVHTWFKVG